MQAGPRYLYDDVKRGIAFEPDGKMSTSVCQALVVRQPGQPVAKTYLSIADYLREIPVKK